MTEGYTITSIGPITVSVPIGARVTVEYGERRSNLQRRKYIQYPIIHGRRKASFDRRLVNDARQFGFVDHPIERRVKQRRWTTLSPRYDGSRKAVYDRRIINSMQRPSIVDPSERRDPNRSGYHYWSSYDHRIRALERRGILTETEYIPTSSHARQICERRSGKDRRVRNILFCEHYRRCGPRRKS